MALEPYALTTTEKAANYLGLDPPDQLDARTLDRLEDAINSASAAVLEFASREFAPKFPANDSDPPVTRDFYASRDGFVSLAPYDLRELTGITVNDGPALTVDDYVLMPLNGFRWTGTFGWLELRSPFIWFYGYDWPIWASSRHRRPKVSITGRWGCAEIPAVAAKATLIAVFHDWYAPGSFGSTTAGPYSYTDTDTDNENVRSLPWESRALLLPHLRPVVGSE